MVYCTHLAEQALGFNGRDHAVVFSALGFEPKPLPTHAQKSGWTFGLCNANGDWISDVIEWYKHDPRANVIGQSRCGDDQCQCRYGNPCPKEDQN